MLDEDHVAAEMMTALPADARERELVQENARLLAAEQRLAEQFQVLSEFSTCIISILDVEELLAQTVRLIRQTFG